MVTEWVLVYERRSVQFKINILFAYSRDVPQHLSHIKYNMHAASTIYFVRAYTPPPGNCFSACETRVKP